MNKHLNLTPGMKVSVREEKRFARIPGNWITAVIERVEIEDGEEYAHVRVLKKEWERPSSLKVHRDDIRPL